MENLLLIFIILLILILGISIINEHFVKLPKEISLVLFSFLLSVIIKLVSLTGILNTEEGILGDFFHFRLDSFLMDGILCFMLFAGAQKVHFNKFIKNIKPISFLALLSTVLSSVLYGAIFYGCSILFSFQMDIWLCILLGAIVSPTDPIAATSILNKCGLSKSVTSVIEGESLFNDGTGVVLFIVIRNLITKTSSIPLPLLLIRELGVAIIVGAVISFLLFRLVKWTKEPLNHILISLLTVSLSYVVCEALGASGVIASVVCGMVFAYEMSKLESWLCVSDPKNLFMDFWDVLDNILNGLLFVLIGCSILYIPFLGVTALLLAIAILLNLIARGSGVGISSLLLKKKNVPNHYTKGEFTSLLTWTGLKGGLSLALALTTGNFLLNPELTTYQPKAYSIIMIVTFGTIFFTIIIQGLTTGFVFKNIEKHKEKRFMEEKGVEEV